VVIADFRAKSLAVDEEVNRLVENGLGTKVKFLTDGALPTWLKDMYGAQGSGPNCITEGSIDNIFNEPALSAHDLEQRQLIQDEYTSLFREIPLAARVDLSTRGAQATVLAILDREYRRFVRDYKGIELSELCGRLVEELPSIVTREKEDEFLRADRALQIAGGICRGIQEKLKLESGSWAAFLGANVENKLGKIDRFRRSWNTALDHLHSAQRVLREMQNAGTGEVDPHIVASELGDALFLEGEIWAVQFLDAPNKETRSQGLRCFREVLKIDQSLGREDPAVNLRIQLLDGF
jgi:hypothetical protein